MRQHSKLLFLCVPALLLAAATACDKMNSINQHWYDQGETIYTGTVDSIKVTPGYRRVGMEWQLGADPRISDVVISWNERRDSVVVPVPRTREGILKMQYILDALDEDIYVFVFETKDQEGHRSIPQEETVTVYGDKYAANLRVRQLSSIEKLTDGRMKLSWLPTTGTAILYSVLEYPGPDGQEIACNVPNEESETLLEGAPTGSEIRLYSVYQPKDSMDELRSGTRSYTLPRLVREMDKSRFSAVVCAGDNNGTQGNNRYLYCIWDGQTANPYILHTKTADPNFTWPHHFTWDIGVPCDLVRFHIKPRSDGTRSYYDHQPRVFELWVTSELKAPLDDASYWKTDAWKADWTRVVNETGIPTAAVNPLDTWLAGWEYEIQPLPQRVRYFRLVAKANWGGQDVVNIGEVYIWGDDL
ncbi:MAG: hypothetical protein IJ654_03170 [Bacteroidales bacterium]|nr:hypothetical protein [Bacteroidales bacterium]